MRRSLCLLLTFSILSLLPAVKALAQNPFLKLGVDEHLGASVPTDLVFLDEQGSPLTLAQLINDKPTILTLIFYNCQGICTPLLNGLAEAVSRSPDLEPGKDFNIVTISFDPLETSVLAKRKRDNYLREVGRPIDAKGWRFLTGTQENIDRICDAVGFRYLKQEGTFIHSGVLTFLSPQGKIVRYLYGGDVSRNIIPFLPFEIQLAVIEASEGRVGPTIHKVLRLCFQYDQAGKRYALSATRISMAVVLVFALAVLLYVTVFCRIGRTKAASFDKKA